MFPICILAGGLATRLRPLTQDTPKAMVNVAGKPFIQWQLERLKASGFSDVTLCLGRFGLQIEEFVGNGARFGLSVRYSYDGPSQLGTGGALKKATRDFDSPFFVMYGDSLLTVNFDDVQSNYNRTNETGLLVVYENKGNFDVSNVKFLGGSCLIHYDKNNPTLDMNFIDYGLMILQTTAFDRFDQEAFDLANVLNQLSGFNELRGYVNCTRFYEIGSHSGLDETTKFLGEN